MKKMSKRLLASVMAVSLLVALVPAVGMAQGIGTVGLETKLDNEIVVYENHFDYQSEANFADNVLNKGGDYGIYRLDNGDADGGVKFTDSQKWYSTFGKSDNFKSSEDDTTGQVRVYNGNTKTKSKGFWIDLDKVLETYGPGAYTFSFRVNSKAGGPGLIEAVLNTAEDQSTLGNILWQGRARTESSQFVNLGGHVLVSREYNTANANGNGDAINNVTFTSTTYIPEGAQHLRFFFGGTVYDSTTATGIDASILRGSVGGSATYLPVFFDDLVITKKANAYQDYALIGDDIKLKSTVTPLNGLEPTGRLIAAMYDADTNEMLDVEISDEMTLTAPTVIESTLEYPGEEVADYKIKTFFFDGFENLTAYSLASNPHESLFPDMSFESPFTNDYRWVESGSKQNVNIATDVAYTGARSLTRTVAGGGSVWLSVGEGETYTASNASGTPSAANPGSPTAWAKMLQENGKGTYKISFMAKAGNANTTVELQMRTYYQDFGKRDVSIGYTPTPNSYDTLAKKTLSTEWQKFEYTYDFTPLPSGRTVSTSNNSGWLSYRNNNYVSYLIARNGGSETTIYIDDFKVEKVN